MPPKRRLYGMWIFKLRSRRPRSKIGRSLEHSTISASVSKAAVRLSSRRLVPSCYLPVSLLLLIRTTNDTKSLFGKRAVTPLFRVPVPILADERASIEKGTGILMVCTFGDATDVEWWRQFDLPLRQVVGKDGRLIPVQFGSPGWESLDPDAANAFYEALQGKHVQQARRAITDLLREESGSALPGLGPPLTQEPQRIEHAVKFYEKGERPLEFISTRQWFVRLLDKKKALLEQGARIQWHPAFMRIAL